MLACHFVFSAASHGHRELHIDLSTNYKYSFAISFPVVSFPSVVLNLVKQAYCLISPDITTPPPIMQMIATMKVQITNGPVTNGFLNLTVAQPRTAKINENTPATMHMAKATESASNLNGV
jgi:hypothetical protein